MSKELPREVTLEDKELSIDDLCLDPNNPRYADLHVTKTIPESRVHEDTVQEQAINRMLDPRFEVEQLKQSIENVGFLRMDRMVVVELSQVDRYMVVEGNRRLAGLKSLLREQQSGEVDLSEKVLRSFDAIPTLIIKSADKRARDDFARTLQGIRHISGMKPWGPYQQALAVGRMINEGITILGIRSVLGLSAQRVNLLRRVYSAVQQMKTEDEFAEFATPERFSDFVEAQKQPKVREWLEWDEEKGIFTNHDHRLEFYRWITGMDDEEGNRLPPKIIDAKDFRLLTKVMADEKVFARFREEPSLSLQDAVRFVDPDPDPQVDWRQVLRRDLRTLETGVPAMDIIDATPDDIVLLQALRDACAKLLASAGGSVGSEAGA